MYILAISWEDLMPNFFCKPENPELLPSYGLAANDQFCDSRLCLKQKPHQQQLRTVLPIVYI